MSIPERAQELIQKYLDLAATEIELAELEKLLAADAEVAHAFAEMARLHANLQGYFRKQYKMDEVAALLNAPEPAAPPLLPAPAAGQPNGESSHSPLSDKSMASPLPLRSTFTPRYRGPYRSRDASGNVAALVRNWKPIAIAVLILVMGAAIWTVKNSGDGVMRLISGRVTVAGRVLTYLPEDTAFEVAGHEAAVIELPGGARIELAAATRASIGRDKNQLVVKLESGGGEFLLQSNHVQPDQPSLRVETQLGVVTAKAGRFSLDLITTLPQQVSPTAAMSIQLPRLVVAVAQGSVTVNRAGVVTTLSAGEEGVFVKAISS
jgi:ferric-dicitrate binding protein FerR (iron transport regulator)